MPQETRSRIDQCIVTPTDVSRGFVKLVHNTDMKSIPHSNVIVEKLIVAALFTKFKTIFRTLFSLHKSQNLIPGS
jgi:hypothetical protein